MFDRVKENVSDEYRVSTVPIDERMDPSYARCPVLIVKK